MTLAVQAWRLREAARDAVLAGDFEQGHGLAQAAQRLQKTPEGEQLLLASAWMAALLNPAG